MTWWQALLIALGAGALTLVTAMLRTLPAQVRVALCVVLGAAGGAFLGTSVGVGTGPSLATALGETHGAALAIGWPLACQLLFGAAGLFGGAILGR